MTSPKIRATIRDVAQAAGVSPSTVSLALRQRARVSKATQIRIEEAALKLNYKSDLLYSLIASRRARGQSTSKLTLGILIDPKQPNSEETNRTLCKAIKAIDCHVEIECVEDEEDIERSLEILRARGCCGIILRLPCTQKRLNPKLFTGIAVVSMDDLDTQVAWPVDTVKRAYGYDMRQAWSRLYHLGYRRIGTILHKHTPTISDDRERIGAALSMQDDLHPISERVPPLISPFGTQNHIEDWIRTHQPDAIICFNTSNLWLIHDMGIQIPQELGIVCLHFDDPQLEIKGSTYEISGYKCHNEQAASSAVNCLLDKLRREQLGLDSNPTLHLIPATWAEGATIQKQG